MLFSIVIPVYKVEKYLNRCVESILNQTFQDFEIILVDDGSPDNCPQLCDDWAKKDTRINVIHKPNGGVSSARNKGINEAKGEYVFFLDSDDTFESELLEFCFPYTKANKQVVYFSYSFVYEDNSKVAILPNVLEKRLLTNEEDRLNLLKDLIKNNNFSGVSVRGCYKRDFLINNNLYFDEKYALSEDVLFNLKVLFNLNEYIETGFLGYNYYSNESSCTNTHVLRGNLDVYNQMSFETYEYFLFKNMNEVIKNYFIIHDMFLGAAQWWTICNIKKIKDIKKVLSFYKVNIYSKFYKEQTKNTLRNYDNPKYKYGKELQFIQLKAKKILREYSLNNSKFNFNFKIIVLRFSLPFKRTKAKFVNMLTRLIRKIKK